MRLLPPFFAFLCLLGAAPGVLAGDAARIEGAWLAPVALEDPGDPLSLAEPERLLVVVYSHGSRPEYRRDRCRPNGGTTPPVVEDLAGARAGGLRVGVFAFCTGTRLGTFEAESGAGEPKVAGRAREIADLAERLAAAGVPPARIVLAGQSAGGWASLLAAARLQARHGALPLGGVLAFAPAFAGEAGARDSGWQRLRDSQAAEIAALPRLPALVYAFAGDPYEPPADLGFLAAIPGVALLDLDAPALGGCTPHPAHLRVFADCFRAAERARLLDFLGAVARRAGRAGAA